MCTTQQTGNLIAMRFIVYLNQQKQRKVSKEKNKETFQRKKQTKKRRKKVKPSVTEPQKCP